MRGQEELPRTTNTGRQENTTMNNEDVWVATPKADLDKATTYTDKQIQKIKAMSQPALEGTSTSLPNSLGGNFFGKSQNEIGRGLYPTSQASPINGVYSSEETTDCNHSPPPELKR